MVELGDIVIDPMVGCGSIPIEGALSSKSRVFYLGSDKSSNAVQLSNENLNYLNDLAVQNDIGKRLLVNILQMDSTNLPLRNQSIDSAITDLPFNKRSGEINRTKLYTNSLAELGRVCRKSCVCLTADRRAMETAIKSSNHLWKYSNRRVINHGGIRAGVYLLRKLKP